MDTRPLFTELYLRNQKAKIQVIGFVQLNSIKDMKKQKPPARCRWFQLVEKPAVAI